jgi:hypothetical protein
MRLPRAVILGLVVVASFPARVGRPMVVFEMMTGSVDEAASEN